MSIISKNKPPCHNHDDMWTAITVTGLVLTSDEMKSFLKMYNKTHMTRFTMSDISNMISTDRLKSGDGNPEMDFRIISCTESNTDGKVFTPYTDADGKLIVSKNKRFEEYSVRRWADGTSYIIPSRYPMHGAYVFDRPYADYEAFKAEFVSKLSNYLPKDFDWDGRLGDFTSIHYVPADF